MDDTLAALGFSLDEIHQCRVTSVGLVVVPATIAGERAELVLDTQQRIDLTLGLAYAKRRQLPYERSAESWGKSPLESFEALGMGRPHEVVVVTGREDETTEYATVGRLGTLFVRRAVCAIDPFDWRLGVSARPELRAGFGVARHRIPLLAGVLDDLPITRALRDERSKGGTPTFLIDTARNWSMLTLEYVERNWTSRWHRRAARRANQTKQPIDCTLTMPDGNPVKLKMYVHRRYAPDYVGTLGVESLDGVLGLDFLYQWLPVLDLAARELALFDLAMPGR